ncbi:MAG: molybdopterin-dependent oxidoreductase [Pseudomonadota bacterium]
MARATRKLFLAAPAVLLVIAVFAAFPMAFASEETLLTLKNPRIDGRHGVITFTRADLESLQQQEITTTNDFIDGEATFRGPLAYALIDQIGRAGAKLVRLTAANDYFVDIAIQELLDYGAILALEMNGKGLTTRDRGPIWLMYPIDQFEELQNPSMNNRLIWQLKTIELQ